MLIDYVETTVIADMSTKISESGIKLSNSEHW